MKPLDETLQMLKDLTDANGIPSNEKAPRAVMRRYIEPLADSIEHDKLGSLIAKKVGDAQGPKILVAGHLDEVGFMVTQVDENGFLYFQPVGGWSNQVMLSQRVTVTTRSGDKIIGIIGSKPLNFIPIDAQNTPVDIKEMFIDVGAENLQQATAWGIYPGAMVTPYFEFNVMKNEKYLLAKAWDNRIGCAIAIDILKQLQNVAHPNIVYSAATVQEEVGLRGAKTTTFAIQPDIGFSVDVGIAGDLPGVLPRQSKAKLGAGPQIVIYDSSMVAHFGLRDLVIDVAQQHQIPYQLESIESGATDAGSIHLTANGVPSLAIGIATRYIHSNAGILHRDDYENTVKLLVEVIKRLDAATVQQLIEGE